jgi:hypothetical protein
MENLTGICEKSFLSTAKWWYKYLPVFIMNLIIIRWFNVHTDVWVDIQNWGDEYDFAVFNPVTQRVHMDEFESGHRIKDYDKIQSRAIKKANSVYNRINLGL